MGVVVFGWDVILCCYQIYSPTWNEPAVIRPGVVGVVTLLNLYAQGALVNIPVGGMSRCEY